MIDLKERQFNAGVFRPKPLIHIENEMNLIAVVTNWGNDALGPQVMDEMVKYLVAAQSDVEVTTPFETILSLNREQNALRHALLIANELMVRGLNREYADIGVEACLLWKKNQTLNWAQIGSPNIYLKNQSSFWPLSVTTDMNVELGCVESAPLPHALMGLEPNCYVTCGNMKYTDGQEILLSTQLLPFVELNTAMATEALNPIAHQILNSRGKSAGWLGLLKIS